jgi:endonuclease/exonuclease/phosphatase family metal-dependent hydrolase
MFLLGQAEIQAVHDWIIDQATNTAHTEKNIVALGDFNANPKGQPHHFDAIVTGTDAYRVLMNEPFAAGESSLRTTVQQSDNPGPSYFLLPVYDHILVSHQNSYALPNNPMTCAAQDLGVVEFDQEGHWQQQNSWNDVIRAMSDHRPVWFKLAYDAADLDCVDMLGSLYLYTSMSQAGAG